jgi:hypothetical protein
MLGCPHNQDACYDLDVCHWPEPDWAGFALPVCTENLNPRVAVMESPRMGNDVMLPVRWTGERSAHLYPMIDAF